MLMLSLTQPLECGGKSRLSGGYAALNCERLLVPIKNRSTLARFLTTSLAGAVAAALQGVCLLTPELGADQSNPQSPFIATNT